MSSVIVLLSLALSTVLLSPGPDHKIEICHVPPGNPANAHTIEVDENAWTNGHSPHNNHNLDYLGACRVDPTPVPPTQEPTDIPESTSTPPATATQPAADPTPTHTWVGPSPTPAVFDAPTTETPVEAPTCQAVTFCSPFVGTATSQSGGSDDNNILWGALIVFIGLIVNGLLGRKRQ